jgi:hypothetical protein
MEVGSLNRSWNGYTVFKKSNLSFKPNPLRGSA